MRFFSALKNLFIRNDADITALINDIDTNLNTIKLDQEKFHADTQKNLKFEIQAGWLALLEKYQSFFSNSIENSTIITDQDFSNKELIYKFFKDKLNYLSTSEELKNSEYLKGVLSAKSSSGLSIAHIAAEFRDKEMLERIRQAPKDQVSDDLINWKFELDKDHILTPLSIAMISKSNEQNHQRNVAATFLFDISNDPKNSICSLENSNYIKGAKKSLLEIACTTKNLDIVKKIINNANFPENAFDSIPNHEDIFKIILEADDLEIMNSFLQKYEKKQELGKQFTLSFTEKIIKYMAEKSTGMNFNNYLNNKQFLPLIHKFIDGNDNHNDLEDPKEFIDNLAKLTENDVILPQNALSIIFSLDLNSNIIDKENTKKLINILLKNKEYDQLTLLREHLNHKIIIDFPKKLELEKIRDSLTSQIPAQELFDNNKMDLLLDKLSKAPNTDQQENDDFVIQSIIKSAVLNRQYNFLEQLLKKRPDLIKADYNIPQILYKASISDTSDVAKNLVEKSLTLLSCDKDGVWIYDFLKEAAKNKDEKIIKKVLQSLNSSKTPELKKFFIDQYNELSKEDLETTSLNYHILFKNLITQDDIKNGIFTNSKDDLTISKSLLAIAIEKNDPELVKVLLDKGANLDHGYKDARDNLICSSLDIAGNMILVLNEIIGSETKIEKKEIENRKGILKNLIDKNKPKLKESIKLGKINTGITDKNNKEDNQKTLSISVLAVSKGLITEKNFADYYSEIDLNAKDNQGNNLLAIALNNGDIELATMLLNQKPSLALEANYNKVTALMYGCNSLKSLDDKERSEFIEKFSKKDILAVDEQNRSCLDYFIAAGDLETAKLLIEKYQLRITQETIIATLSIDDETTREQITKYIRSIPSGEEAFKNRYKVKNKSGQNFLSVISVLKEGDIAINLMEEAIKNGSDVNCKDIKGATPLWHAVAHGDHAKVELLLNNQNLNPNIPDKSGNTPLMLACFRYNTQPHDREAYADIISSLLKDNRITKNNINSDNLDAFSIVKSTNSINHMKGQKELIAEFLKYGADPIQDTEKDTFLYRITKTGLKMAITTFVSKLCAKVIPGTSTLANTTEAIIHANLVGNMVGEIVKDKVSQALNQDKVDLTGLTLMGNYHIDSFGRVITGKAMKSRLEGNQYYTNTAKAIFSLESLQTFLYTEPKPSQEQLSTIRQSIFLQYSNIKKELATANFGFLFGKRIRNNLNNIIEDLKEADERLISNLKTPKIGNSNFTDLLKDPKLAAEQLNILQKSAGDSDTIEKINTFVTVLKDIKEGLILVTVEQRANAYSLLFEYQKLQLQDYDQSKAFRKENIIELLNNVIKEDYSNHYHPQSIQAAKSTRYIDPEPKTNFRTAIDTTIEKIAVATNTDTEVVKEKIVEITESTSKAIAGTATILAHNPTYTLLGMSIASPILSVGQRAISSLVNGTGPILNGAATIAANPIAGPILAIGAMNVITELIISSDIIQQAHLETKEETKEEAKQAQLNEECDKIKKSLKENEQLITDIKPDYNKETYKDMLSPLQKQNFSLKPSQINISV